MSHPSASPPLRDRARGPLLIGIAVLVAAVVAVGSRDYLRWRHGRIALEVMQSTSANDFATAELALSRVNPTWVDPELLTTCRLAVWRVTDPAAALTTLAPSLALPAPTLEHRRLAAELALRARRLDDAARFVTALRTVAPQDAETQFLAAWLAFEHRDFAAAVPELRGALALQPVHRGARLLRASLLAESENYVEYVRGRAELRLLATGQDLLALEARITIAAGRHTVTSTADRTAALRAVLAHPLAGHAQVLRRPDVLQALLGAGQGLPVEQLLPFVERLRSAHGDNPRALEVAIYFLQEGSRADEAGALLPILERAAPDGINTLILHGRQQLLARRWTEAAQTLTEAFARTSAAAAPPPLVGFTQLFLDPARPVPTEQRRTAAELACRLPADDFARWLLARQRLFELAPDRRAALVAEVQASAQDRRALPAAEWLLRHSAPAAAGAVAGPLAATGDLGAVYLAFEAEIAQQHFGAADQLVQRVDAATLDGTLLRARLALAQHDRPGAIALWRAGLAGARTREDNSGVLRLASGAARLGLTDEARDAYRLIADAVLDGSVPADAAAVSLWLGLALRQGDSRDAHRIALCLASKPGGEKSGRYWSTYLDLLMNENVLAAKDAARDLLAGEPENPGTRAVFALAQLRTGQHAAALTTVRDTVQSTLAAPLTPQTRVVLAAVCAANNLPAEALRWRESVGAGETLLPEERRLVDAGAPRG